MQRTYRKLAHKNQNRRNMGVGCFDLGHSNLSAQLKALAAAIRFSSSSCFMLEGIDDSGGWDAEEGLPASVPRTHLQSHPARLTGD